MKRRIFLYLVALVLSTTCAWAQGSKFNDTVFVNSTPLKNISLDKIVSKYDNGKTVIILEGREYQTAQIRIRNGVKLMGKKGAKITPQKGKVMNALVLADGYVEIDQVILDGAGKVFWGIFSTSSVNISNTVIQNFYGNKAAPGNGIRHLPKNQNSRLTVSNSTIRNISSFEDGKVGNYIGATRGVLSSGGNVKIVDVKFSNILGTEDADCIHIQTKTSKDLVWASAGRVIIENCTFSGFGKRAVKIQGSDVSVINNNIKSDITNNYAAISIYGSNNVIKGNKLDLMSATAGITVNSGKRNQITSNEIVINREKAGQTMWGIVLDKDSETVIEKNRFVTNGKRFPVYLSKNSMETTKQKFQKQNTVEVK